MPGNRKRGVALVLVLGAVAVLSVLAIELAARANVDVMIARRTAREAAFRRVLDSGTAVGRALLSEPEANAFDYWGDPWNRRVEVPLGPGEKVSVRVEDESGKILVAGKTGRDKLARRLGRLFEYLKLYAPPDPAYPWKEIETRVTHRLGLGPVLEGDEEEEATNDEKKKPSEVAPMLTLDAFREAGLSAHHVFGPNGLARYLTTFGKGKVNINTAPPAVLYALGEDLDAALVQRIAEYRGDPTGTPGVYTPFEEVRDLELVDGVVQRRVIDGHPRVMRNLAESLRAEIATASECFSVRLEARLGDRTRIGWAFFEPGRNRKPGEPVRRSLKRIAYEEVGP